MSIFIKKNGKKVIPRSIYVKILILLFLVGVSAAALKPVQTLISGAISNIRTNLIGRLEEFTGLEIRYSSIRPSFFTSFDIRNIALYKNENEVLTISRARIYFSLRELIFNKKTVIHTIQIDHPVIRLDTEKDRELFDLIKNLSGTENKDKQILQQIADFLPEKTNYRIRNLFFSLTDGESSYSAENMNVNITSESGNILLSTSSDIEIIYSEFFGGSIILNTKININGSYISKSQESRAGIEFSEMVFQEHIVNKDQNPVLNSVFPYGAMIPALAENIITRKLFTVNPFTAMFIYGGKKVQVYSLPENNENGFSFIYDTEEKSFSAEAVLNNFKANSKVNLTGVRKELDEILALPLTGRLSFDYYDPADFSYSANLKSGNFLNAWYENSSNAFSVNAYGDREGVIVNELSVSVSSALANNKSFQGAAGFSGSVSFSPLRPSGILTINRLSLTGSESFKGVFEISNMGNDIHITGRDVTSGSYSPQAFYVNVTPAQTDIGIALSCIGSGDENIFLDVMFNRNPGVFEASLSVNSLKISSITEAAAPFTDIAEIPSPVSMYTGGVSLDANVFISSDFVNYAYNAPDVVLKNENIIGSFSLSGTNHNFSLREGIINLGQNDLYLFADADFTNPMDLDFSLNARYIDISWNMTGHVLDRNTLIIHDPNGLHVYGNMSRTGAVSGYIEGIDFPVPARVHPAYVDFYAALRYDSRDFWSFDADYIRIRDLYSDNGSVDLSFFCSADQNGALFRSITFSDDYGKLTGSADFSWNRDFSYIQFLANMADANASGESYYAEGRYSGRSITLDASVNEMRLDRFIKGNGAMLASAKANVSWTSIDSFESEINISSFTMENNSKPVKGYADVYISAKELIAKNLRIDFSGLETEIPSVFIIPGEGIAGLNSSTKGILAGTAGEKNLAGKVTVDASFKSVSSWLDIKDALNSLRGSLHVDNFQFGNVYEEKSIFNFSSIDGAVSIYGGKKDMLKIEIDPENNLFISLSDPLPIRGSFTGVIEKFDFDIFTNNYYIDLAALWDVTSINQDNFSITGGYINGKMNLKGPVWNPEFSGTGKCTSLKIQVPGFITDEIRAVPFDVIAEGYEMTFTRVEALSGYGSAFASGWFRFDNYVPRNIGLEITVPRETAVPYNFSISGFHANGDVSGELELNFSSAEGLMEINGNLYMNNTEMVHLGVGDSSEDTDRRINSIIELAITTGPNVEFFWPNINSPILRVSPELRTVFLISADTQAGQFSLTSDIKIRSGEMYYLDRNFYIREGTITMRENETQFNPRLNLRAEIRDRAESGPVTISMIIENQPLLSFNPRFEASPNLTQLEIYSILGQNLYVQSGDNPDMVQRFFLTTSTSLIAQLVSGSDVMTQLNFARQIEKGMRDFFHLDLLSIRTRFIENTVASGAAALGTSSLDRVNRVGNYFDNTTVFIGKYIGQDMFIQSTLRLRYDENSTLFGGIRLEPDFGIELQNPYFRIRWDFYPYNPRNWWMNDHSISLIWSRSFK